MWINFSATKPFAVKVYAGGVNAVSGESKVVTEATKQRRKEVRSLASEILLHHASGVLGGCFTFNETLLPSQKRLTFVPATLASEIHSGLYCAPYATLA